MDITKDGVEEAEAEEIEFTDLEISMVSDRLRSEQNFVGGFAAGGIAAIVGGAIWAFITVETGWQIGFMAIGVGFLVGIAVGLVGKGIDQTFGFVGAAWAVLGCALGNLFAVCGFISKEQGIPLLELLGRLDFAVVSELMVATFSPMDLLFYGLAVGAGYRYSFRQLTQQEIEAEL